MIPINHFLYIYLSVYLISSVTEILIDLINEGHLKRHGNVVPHEFKGWVDQEELKEINRYNIDNARFGVKRTVTGKLLLLIIILSGLLPWLTGILENLPYLLAGLIFFAIPGSIGALVDLPFAYYQIFHIEERYGFNTRTIRTWVSDLFKSLIISVVLGAILLSLLMLTVRHLGGTWWLYAWMAFFAFQILLTVLYPTVIAPIFNKFTPIGDNELDKEIRDLSEREGISVKGVFQMDAGKRSKHTNAYFTGIGKTKRIVLYDTLLEAHKSDEIMAVLAHEIGHLKKGHIRKQLIIMGFASLILFFIASRMMSWDIMYESFGFSEIRSYAGLFLIAIIWEPVGFFLSPLAMWVSRRFEGEADKYVSRVMSMGGSLISGLKKMTRDNMSNLLPHPLYIRFHYSHPPLLDRIRNIEKWSGQDQDS